jgi:hypothetical protein
MLTHAKKASDAKDDVFHLARLVQDDIVYIAYLFVCFIVDVNADKFRSSPFALPLAWWLRCRPSLLCSRWIGRLGGCCARDQRGAAPGPVH